MTKKQKKKEKHLTLHLQYVTIGIQRQIVMCLPLKGINVRKGLFVRIGFFGCLERVVDRFE